jgi:hypothetical protein
MVRALGAIHLSVPDAEYSEQLTLTRWQSKMLNIKSMSNIIPRSTAVTTGNARGMVVCGYPDGRLVESGVQRVLERTIDDSATMPAIFHTLINEPRPHNTGEN